MLIHFVDAQLFTSHTASFLIILSKVLSHTSILQFAHISSHERLLYINIYSSVLLYELKLFNYFEM